MATGVVLGQAVLELTADSNKMVAGIRDAKTQSDGLFGGILKGASGVAAGIMGAQGLGAAVGFVKDTVFGLAAGFEQQMDIMQAVSGATESEFKALGAQAKALGADISLPGTSAKDAAEAMLELSKAGLSVNDVMTASKGVLQLSAAGALSNASAAEITANALNAFGLAGSEATRIADLLAATANASSVEVSDLALSMASASMVFAKSGLTIDDLTASLGLMGNAGIKGSDAGTSLRAMLLNVQAPSAKTQKLMDQLGFSMYDADENMKSLNQITANLASSFSGLTEQERDEYMARIFGNDGIRAATVLMKAGVGGLEAMRDATTKGGEAAAFAAARNKGLAGAMDAIKSSIETVQITIGSLLLPRLADMARAFAGAVGQIEPLAHLFKLGFQGGEIGGQFSAIEKAVFSAGERFREIWAVVQNVASVIRDQLIPPLRNVLARFVEIGGVQATVVGFITALTVGFGILAVAVIAATLPFVAIVVGITALAAGVVLLIHHWEALVAQFPILGTIADKVGEAIGGLQEHFERFPAYYAESVKPAMDNIMTAVGAVVDFFREHWPQIQTIVQPILDEIQNRIETFGTIVTGVLDIIILLIKGDFSGAWSAVKELVADVVGSMIESATNLKDLVIAALTLLKDAGLVALGALWDLGKAGFVAMKDEIAASAQGLYDAVVGKIGELVAWFGGLKGMLLGVLGGAIGWLVGIGQDIVNGLWNGVQGRWDAFVGYFVGLYNALPSFVRKAIEAFSPSRVFMRIGEDMVAGSIVGAQNMRDPLLRTFGEIFDAIAPKIRLSNPSLVDVLADMGALMQDAALVNVRDPLLRTFGEIFEAIAPKIRLALTTGDSSIEDLMRDMGALMQDFALQAGGQFNAGLIEGLAPVTQTVGTTIDQLKAMWNDYSSQTGISAKELDAYYANMQESLAQLGAGMKGIIAEDFSLVKQGFYDLTDTVAVAGKSISASSVATVDSLLRAWEAWATGVNVTESKLADYYGNMQESLRKLGEGFQGIIAEDFSIVPAQFYDVGRGAAEGFADGIAPLTPFLDSVAEAVALWGEGIVAEMTDTFRQALAISASIADQNATLTGTAAANASIVSHGGTPLATTAASVAGPAYAAPSASGAVTQAQMDYIDAMNAMPSYAHGTSFVPRNMLANLHRGERVVPASENRGEAGGAREVKYTHYGDLQLVHPNVRNSDDMLRSLDWQVT